MKTLPTTFDILIDGSLRLAAQHWQALGVRVQADRPPEAIVDPEALLWLTLEVGRHEPRLFDEALDWLVANREWIALPRLRALGPAPDDERWAALGAAAAHIVRRAGDPRWQRLAKKPGGDPLLARAVPFFLQRDGKGLTVPEQTDPLFRAKGFARSVFERSERSAAPPLTERTSLLLLRATALFGAEARAYAWAALLHRPDGALLSELAEHTGFTRQTVANSLSSFLRSGICVEERRRTAKHYRLRAREEWRDILNLRRFPVWPHWPGLFEPLIRLIRTERTSIQGGASDYIATSALRREFIAVKDDLVRCGIRVSLPEPDLHLVDAFRDAFNEYFRVLLETALFLPGPGSP